MTRLPAYRRLWGYCLVSMLDGRYVSHLTCGVDFTPGDPLMDSDPQWALTRRTYAAIKRAYWRTQPLFNRIEIVALYERAEE